MVNPDNLKPYLTAKRHAGRSNMQNILVIDGFVIHPFRTTNGRWEGFPASPARIVTQDRKE